MINKRRKITILILSLFFVLLLGAGLYFLLRPKTNTTATYNVDKYADITTWCDASTETKTLSVDCKGLLLNIRNTEDGTSCFDIQVITKDKELKDISVCEESDSLSYTNDILQYKKLMPVDMVFSYTKNGVLNSYVFSNISLSKVDDTYIQNIVNEDITNLTSLTIDNEILQFKLKDTDTEIPGVDSSTYTVQNSIDFCPNPSLLVDYVTDENKSIYSSFYASNVSEIEDLSVVESWNGDLVIRKLFACEGANLMNYQICQTLNTKSLPSESKEISSVDIAWGYDLSTDELMYLKIASLIYDNLQMKTSPDITTIASINGLADYINSVRPINENVVCASYHLYNLLSEVNSTYKSNAQLIYNEIAASAGKIESGMCGEILSNQENIDTSGLYLRLYFAEIQDSSILRIYNRCNNLRLFMK